MSERTLLETKKRKRVMIQLNLLFLLVLSGSSHYQEPWENMNLFGRERKKEEDASLILRKKVERVTPNDPANIFRISSLNLTDCFS